MKIGFNLRGVSQIRFKKFSDLEAKLVKHIRTYYASATVELEHAGRACRQALSLKFEAQHFLGCMEALLRGSSGKAPPLRAVVPSGVEQRRLLRLRQRPLPAAERLVR